MDLKEFISNSLTQIIDGIRDAQERSEGSGAWISPTGDRLPSREHANQLTGPNGAQYLDDVQFDVAVTVSEENSGKAGASIKILGASVGAGGAVTAQNSAVSRIQFAVPVMWPGSTNLAREKKVADNIDKNMKKLAASSQRARPRI